MPGAVEIKKEQSQFEKDFLNQRAALSQTPRKSRAVVSRGNHSSGSTGLSQRHQEILSEIL